MRTGSTRLSNHPQIFRHSFEDGSANTFRSSFKDLMRKLSGEYPQLKAFLIKNRGFSDKLAGCFIHIFEGQTDTLFIIFDLVFIKEPERLSELLLKLENNPRPIRSTFEEAINKTTRNEYPYVIEAEFKLKDNKIVCELAPKTTWGGSSITFKATIVFDDIPAAANQSQKALAFLENTANYLRGLFDPDRRKP